MTITVAGEAKTFDDGISLARLMELEQIENAAYVTAAVNDELVRADSFGLRMLEDGDVVELLYFMGGGAAHGLL